MPDESPNPLRIFWSYSHEDEELRDKLDSHLAALKRAKRVAVWHDRKILGGSNWRSEIDRELDAADIILLLVSATFLDSDFCHSVELRRALERHEARDALVIPIMLRPCDVTSTPIERLQQLPAGGKPITKWGNRDEACQDVAKRLRIALEEWTAADSKRRSAVTDRTKSDEQTRLETVISRIFGLGQSVTLLWLQTVLRRGSAVARIERLEGHGYGTGFLVDPVAFGLAPSDVPHLLTCSFVISPDGAYQHSLRPSEAVVRFQMAGVARRVASVLWASPVDELRTILVTLDGPVPGSEPVPIASQQWRPADETSPSNIVVVAHPGGRDLEFSLQDTALLDADDWRLHYRAATEGGSSGGLVLRGNDLKAVAIHSSRGKLARLHGQPGWYEVCEGISLLAIQNAVRKV